MCIQHSNSDRVKTHSIRVGMKKFLEDRILDEAGNECPICVIFVWLDIGISVDDFCLIFFCF